MNYVPMVIVKDGRTERAYDIYSRLLKDRIIMLQGHVTDEMASVICSQILFLASEDQKKDIRLYINSPGGSVYAGMAIVGAMRTCNCDVETVTMGEAMSMGSFIAAAGTKGKRKTLKECTWMIHEVSSGAQGKNTDLKISIKETDRLNKKLATDLARYTGQSLEKVLEDIERDNYMTAEEAKEYGLCDVVI